MRADQRLARKGLQDQEPVAMDRKLLFEVDLTDDAETTGRQGEAAALDLTRGRGSWRLDRFGKRVFTDGRVRKALAELAGDPPKAWLECCVEETRDPGVSAEALRRSLARILDAPTPPTPAPTEVSAGKAAASPPGPPAPPKGQEYDLEHHLGNKSALIKELFDEVNAFGISLGGDVTRRIRKIYIGYFRGKRSFFTIELQHQRALIYLSLDPDNHTAVERRGDARCAKYRALRPRRYSILAT